jgi:hypothetical protein
VIEFKLKQPFLLLQYMDLYIYGLFNNTASSSNYSAEWWDGSKQRNINVEGNGHALT